MKIWRHLVWTFYKQVYPSFCSLNVGFTWHCYPTTWDSWYRHQHIIFLKKIPGITGQKTLVHMCTLLTCISNNFTLLFVIVRYSNLETKVLAIWILAWLQYHGYFQYLKYFTEFLDTATYTEPALELHSRTVPSSKASPLSRSWHREKSRRKVEQGKKYE